MTILLLFSLILNSLFIFPNSAYAASSPWAQTDWAGGSGQTSWSDNTKFSSSSNVTTSTSGQVTLTATGSWYNTSWAYRRKITFDNSAQAENLTNFPVLVKLDSTRINYSNTQDSGQDIRFTDSDGTTLLSHEIEKWDETGNSFVWVKVPQIDASSSTDNIYMYYGNTSAADAQAATSVWSNGYSHVYHLNNSTTNSADGNTSATFGTNGVDTTGQFAQGRTKQSPYTGNTLTITQDRATASPLTIETWFKPDGFRDWDDVIKQGWVGNGININVPANQKVFWGVAASGVSTGSTSTATLTDATWVYISGTYDGTTVTLYLNGSSNGTPATVSGAATDITSNIASITDTDRGTVDEIRISSVTRSAAWIAASYKSEADTFNTFASEEPQVQTSGSLTSSILDAGASANWGTLSYTVTTPTNTSASVKVRTSSSSSMNGATDFSSCTAITSASDISSNSCVSDSHRYIQYQIALSNTNGVSTPTFQDLSISLFASLDLDSPSDNSYTNNERPTFKWKLSSDAISGLSKYVLEIDNGETNDFSINDIPISRTSDLDANKYYIKYENFSDSDSANNYISVYTKSSSEWANDTKTGENDGRLKEGKRTWKVKAIDSVSNETTSSRTLFVDRTNPKTEFTQINDIPFSTSSNSNFSTTSKKPSIFGKITDTLSSGDSSSATQNDNGPKVASGPKSIEVKLEKKNNLGEYTLHTLSTLNLTESYFTSSNSKITDNSKQTSDKYSSFEFIPKEDLTLGSYRVTITGKDNADNTSSSTSFTLNITTLAEITTPEEKTIIEEEIEEFKEETQEKIKEDLGITKPTETLPPPSALEKAGENITQTTSVITNAVKQSLAFVGNGIKIAASAIGNGLLAMTNAAGQGLAFVGNTIGNGYNNIAQHAPGVTKDIMLAIGNTASNTINGTKNGIANIAFAIGEKADGLSNSVSVAIVKFGYLFSTGPTKISDVKVIVLSSSSAKISWKTNHPANGKVNYGLDETYPLDKQSEKRTTHHEFTLTNLKPDTQYHFEVMSQNKNYVYDANRRFKTPGK